MVEKSLVKQAPGLMLSVCSYGRPFHMTADFLDFFFMALGIGGGSLKAVLKDKQNLSSLNNFRKYKNIFSFFIIFEYWDSACS